MHSLLSLSGTISPAPALSARDAAPADASGTLFASFLTTASVAAEPGQAPATEALPLPQQPANLLPPGIGLPPASGTGKFLPLDLPPAAEDAPSPEDGVHGAANVAALPPFVTVPPMALLPQPAATPLSGSTTESPPAGGAAALVLPRPLRTGGKGAHGPHTAIALALPATETGEPQSPPSNAPAVTLTMDPAPAKAEARPPFLENAPRFTRAAAAPSPAQADQFSDQQHGQNPHREAAAEQPLRFSAAPPATQAGEAQAAPLSFAPAALPASPNVAALATAPGPALQDISAIVARLASAREALAPATASLSLDHAEFGELRLRFEQQQDGQLVVGLSASNAEAHRAVAAALAAERNPFTGGDRPGEQQQQNGQPRTASGGGSLDRGTGSGSHSGDQSGSGQARHDTPRNAPAPQGRRSAGGHETRQGGIFA